MKALFKSLLALCCLIPAAGVPAAAAGTPAAGIDAALLAAAQAKPAVTWYESSPNEQTDKVLAVFAKKYPDVKVRHIRLVGGNELLVRAVQEMQARGYTGDVLTGGADHLWQLNQRGYIDPIDWGQFGLPAKLMPVKGILATTASVYVLLWNTDKVKDADAPATWAQLLDHKWKGRVGAWVRASAFAQLAATEGPDRAKQQLQRFVALKPMLFKSTFPLAQAVGAGEVDIGLGFYHSTLPPMKAGAPIKMHALDVVPMHTIYSGVSAKARNKEGAEIFLAWLNSEEGALAYERATGRGNPLIPQTETAHFIQGKKLSEWPMDKSGELGRYNEEYNRILETVGAAR